MERSDHVEATIKVLEWFIAQLRGGKAPADLGALLGQIARMMEHKT